MRRRQLLLLTAALAVLLLVAVVLVTGDRFWGTGRSNECSRLDEVQAQYDEALATSTDPSDARVAQLAAEVSRLRGECRERAR